MGSCFGTNRTANNGVISDITTDPQAVKILNQTISQGLKFRVIQRPASSAGVDGGTRPPKYLTNHLGYRASQEVARDLNLHARIRISNIFCELRALVILRRPVACGNRDVSWSVTDAISTAIRDDDFTSSEVFVRESCEWSLN